MDAFDFQMPLLVVSLAGAAGVIIYLVSVFGIREKTFEEAIAAQKEISLELLGRKELKKKAVKRKLKSKKEEKEKEKPVATAPKEKEVQAEKEPHPHVGICSHPIILDENTVRRPSLVGGRRDSIKSILVNKAEVSPVTEGDVIVETNHFENKHPKDDFEMKKQASTEEEGQAINGVEENDADGEEELGETEAVVEAPVVETQVLVTSSEPVTTNNNSRKTSKKGKKGLVQVAQTEPLNATKLVEVIDKVTLSSDEIQDLIEYLLNRQLDAAGIANEWVNKSKSDTTATLKKALQEREKQLAEEQSTVETLQQKLKDLRQEFSSEKGRLSATKKQMEDRNNTLQQEYQQLQVRFQQLNTAMGEKQGLERQVQELQRRMQVSDQNFRLKAEGLEHEAEALRTQCSHLESQLKSSFQSNSDLAAQVRALQEHNRNIEMKVVDFEHLQGFSAQLQERETQLINELKRVEGQLLDAGAEKNVLVEKIRELEGDLRASKEDGERRVEESHQSEKNAKNLLQDTKASLSQSESQLKAKEIELKQARADNDNLTEEIHALNQKLIGDGQGLEKKLAEIEGTVKNLSSEKAVLTQELSHSRNEVEALRKEKDDLKEKTSSLAEILRVTEQNLESTTNVVEDQTQQFKKLADSFESKLEDVERKAKDSLLSSIQSQMESLAGISINKNSSSWLEEFFKDVENQHAESKAVVEENASQIEKLEGEVKHYQHALKTTESLLRNLEQSIETAEKGWEQRLLMKEEELDVARKSLANISTVEMDLGHLREENSKLLLQTKDLESEVSKAKAADTVSIAALEELKIENQELRSQLQKLSHSSIPEVTNANGTSSPKSLNASTLTVDSKEGDSRSGEGEPLSPGGETKKKKKAASARKEKKT